MPKISIIVPIYNMQELMRRCVDSLLAQTFRDFELLLIDDGSTDGSSLICDEYLSIDSRVHVFHKENGGLSDARNYGLKYAKGKYSIFADPDDWVSPDGLDMLYAKAEENNADMVICDYYSEDDYLRKLVKQQFADCTSSALLVRLFHDFGSFTWNKLTRTSLYEKFDIDYPKGIYGCEDQYTMARFFLHDIKIEYVPVAFYHYMYNSNSLSRYYDEHTYEMDVHILQMFDELLKDTPAYDIAHRVKYNAIFSRAFWNGKKYYSSTEFKLRFRGYVQNIRSLNEQKIVKICMFLSCKGFYQWAIHLVYFLFEGKQMLKKIKTKLIR